MTNGVLAACSESSRWKASVLGVEYCSHFFFVSSGKNFFYGSILRPAQLLLFSCHITLKTRLSRKEKQSMRIARQKKTDRKDSEAKAIFSQNPSPRVVCHHRSRRRLRWTSSGIVHGGQASKSTDGRLAKKKTGGIYDAFTATPERLHWVPLPFAHPGAAIATLRGWSQGECITSPLKTITLKRWQQLHSIYFAWFGSSRSRNIRTHCWEGGAGRKPGWLVVVVGMEVDIETIPIAAVRERFKLLIALPMGLAEPVAV